MTTTANSQFFAILTAVGEAKQANADALGVPWTFSAMGVGDANGTEPIPSRTQTKLIAEQRRAPLNQVKIDPNNANIIIAEQVIPPDVGGWWIREIGLYDADGDLVAVANCAPSFKPLLSQGTGKTQVVRLNIIVTSSANVQLKIDPSVVLATREYVETVILAVLPPNRPAGTYTRVQINERGVVVAGSNPTTLAGYGITDALKKGDYGLGGITAPVAPVDTVGLAGGFYFFGAGETTLANYISLINVPYGNNRYTAQIGFTQGTAEPVMLVRTCASEGAFGPTREIYHSGNFSPADKADKATTLGGYGIPIASKPEAEAGADNAKPMTALRVFQAIAKVVVQATETAFGWLKIATQDQVDAGLDDTAAVTPKKIRSGYGYSFGASSFIALPTWLGGLVVQWGSAVSDASGVAVVTLPATFPYGAFQVVPNVLSSSFSTYSINRASSTASSFTALTTSSNIAVGGASFGWLAIGR